MSPETVARWQFGITTVYHYLFVPLTIALSLLTAVLQTVWTRTGNSAYLRLTKFFGKLFLINFAMGVVTGIVQEFQFGMNWSEYSRFVGDIFGAPLALEALIAFFLESTFLGIWIFGWGRLSKGVHLTSIWLGSIGTFISSIFIIAANAWMQNPTGAVFANGRAELNDFLALLTNPVFLTQWPHTIAASFVTAGAFMAAISFYRLVKAKAAAAPDGDLVAYRKGTKIGAWVLIVAGLCTIVTGDLLGKQMVVTQPSKMAAAEGLQTSPTPGEATFQILPGVELFPGFLNWLYGTDNIQGLDELEAQFRDYGYRQQTFIDCLAENGGAPQSCLTDTDGNPLGQEGLQAGFADQLATIADRGQIGDLSPDTTIAFWSFRLMIGIGLLAMLGGIFFLVAVRKDKVPRPSGLMTAIAVVMPLLPLLANSFGWIFTEMGRQPWIVNGVLPTQLAISPDPTLAHSTPILLLTLILYTVLYGVLAVIEVKLLLKYIKIGLPPETDVPPVDLNKDEDAPLSFAY
ncbi:MAG: cytochrome ubiquinol oxidase subunit I [Propionibacteriaceae bacterium]|jgi:cytochrome d ubiquinol oxidase subunit I|nr:cytochrome ubiquinol oxidase subunit I [Propionibacteriaceae bacterium]